jgi:Flp pilus assembly protein TadB
MIKKNVALLPFMRYDIGVIRQNMGGTDMLTAEAIQSMGRKNCSANTDLTMQRTKDVFKSAKRTQKNDIDALTGLKRVSIARVYATGIITAKVAVAIGQVLDINPFYLTGEAEERGSYAESLPSFLKAKGHSRLIKAIESGEPKDDDSPKVSEQAASDKQEQVDLTPKTEPLFTSAFSSSPELAKAAEELSLEEAYQLLTALSIRAKAGGNAAQLFDFIKRGLLM